MNALIVKRYLLRMEIANGSIVATSALLLPDLEAASMSEEQFNREKLYMATMHLAKKLLKQGIISEKQYEDINEKFTNKYGISLSSLFTISMRTAITMNVMKFWKSYGWRKAGICSTRDCFRQQSPCTIIATAIGEELANCSGGPWRN